MSSSSNLFDYSDHAIIHTPRTVLRPVTLEDADDVFKFRGDHEVTKFNSGVAFTSIEQSKGLISSMIEQYAAKESVRWGITLRSRGDDSIRGMVGFNYWNQTDHRGSIGLELHRDEWGKGIMSEALTAVINFGFDKMQMNRIEACASAYNEKCLTMLKRLRFEVEGTQREQYYEDGKYHDLIMLALLKKDWKGVQ